MAGCQGLLVTTYGGLSILYGRNRISHFIEHDRGQLPNKTFVIHYRDAPVTGNQPLGFRVVDHMGGLGRGQKDGNGGTSAQFSIHGQLSVVSGDDAVGHGQAQPAAFLFGGEYGSTIFLRCLGWVPMPSSWMDN